MPEYLWNIKKKLYNWGGGYLYVGKSIQKSFFLTRGDLNKWLCWNKQERAWYKQRGLEQVNNLRIKYGENCREGSETVFGKKKKW